MDDQLKLAYLTAGAAGMYCGSCMRDNTLATAMQRLDVDMCLIPTYTPIRTDEENVSIDRVFFGGINIFLQQKIPLFRYLPKNLDRILDLPSLIRFATRKTTSMDPKQLGSLTVSMLKGKSGYQRKEVDRLCNWLAETFSPSVINLSNALIAGCVPELKKRFKVPVLITLQGDDIFLDELTEKHRREAIAEIQRIDGDVDAYITFSDFYANYMAEYLGIDRQKIHHVPLGIETREFDVAAQAEESIVPSSTSSDSVTIGYLARLAPEKGLHLLVDAFIQLHQRYGASHCRLHIAGWLGEHRKAYADEQFEKLKAAGLEDSYRHFGSITRGQKLDFLNDLDVLSVPTTFAEPKGIYVLEALAAGVPVIQPDHGAFPELLDSTAGGRLCMPLNATDLADQIHALISDRKQLRELGAQGRKNVHEKHTAELMAKRTLEVIRKVVSRP